MIYVFLSICCSVFVSVMLKLAKRYKIDIYQAISWNYAAAVLLTLVFLRPSVQNPGTGNPVLLYSSLGVLLPVIFVIIALSIRFAGIVRTDIAQRLSLFIPLIASFFLFNEQVSDLKTAGLITALAAILFSIPWHQRDPEEKSGAGIILLPIVFAGMGLIDVLFKEVALHKSIPYTSSLFYIYCLSFLVSLLILGYRLISKQSRFHWINVLCGFILGFFNFGNILFYLKAHQIEAARPSLIFTSMNIGVISIGALVGLLIFKEKLSLLNKLGIIIAIAAIIIISYS